jgi:hypothetical protein
LELASFRPSVIVSITLVAVEPPSPSCNRPDVNDVAVAMFVVTGCFVGFLKFVFYYFLFHDSKQQRQNKKKKS